MRTRKLAIVALFYCLLLPLTTVLRADGAEVLPTESVLLTVSGKIDGSDVDGTAQFDMEMLRSFSPTSFSTSTIWTQGVHVFTGVPLVLLLESLGSSGSTLRVSAVNDYSVEIPVVSLDARAPIIAYERDGAPMHLRDKGPLWIVYPFDDDPKHRTSVTYSRSIWQLDRIEVLD